MIHVKTSNTELRNFLVMAATAIAVSLGFGRQVSATSPQVKDLVVFEAKQYRIAQLPLQKIIREREKKVGKPLFRSNTSNNWKGYFAKWEITNKKLTLVKFEGIYDENVVRIDDVIDGARLPLEARWFTGKIQLPVGQFDYENNYRTVILELSFEKGRLIQKSTKRNAREVYSWDGIKRESVDFVPIYPFVGTSASTSLLRYKRIQDELKLSRSQAQELSGIFSIEGSEVNAFFRNSNDLSKMDNKYFVFERRMELIGISDKFKTEAIEVLTEDQRQRLSELRLQYLSVAAFVNEEVLKQLAVSGEQRNQLVKIWRIYDRLFRNLVANQKRSGRDYYISSISKESAIQRRDLKEEYMKKCSDLLTESQQQQFNAMSGKSISFLDL